MSNFQIQFFNNLTDIIKIIVDNLKSYEKYKEVKSLFKNYYNKFSTLSSDELKLNFIGNFNKHILEFNKEISVMDESLFSNDISQNPVNLFYDLDLNFKTFWKYIDYSCKDQLWKKIKSVYTMSIFILKSHEEYKELIQKQKQIKDLLIEELNSEHKIRYEMEQMLKQEELENSINFEDLKNKFGDGIFTELIIDIIKELKIDKNNSLEQLLNIVKGGNGENMEEIMTKIMEKMKLKMELRNITEKQIFAEFDKVKDKCKMMFDEVPVLKDLMDKLTDGIKNIFEKEEGGQETDSETEKSKFVNYMEELKNIASKLSDLSF
jgi:hypothetical protein